MDAPNDIPASEDRQRAARLGSLRHRLVLLVGIGLLPPTAALFALLAWAYTLHVQIQDDSLAGAAAVLSAAVDREVEKATATLDVLAASLALASGDLAAFNVETAAVRRRHPEWTSILLVPMHGDAAEAPPPDEEWPGEEGPGGPRPDLRDAIATNALRSWGPQVSRVPGLPSVTVSRPVVLDGRIAHVLTLSLDPAALGASLFDDRPDRRTLVYEDDGYVVAASRRALRPGDRRTPPWLAAAAAYSGVAVGPDADAAPMRTAFHRSPATGLTVAVMTPADAVAAPFLRATATGAAVCLALLAVGLGAAWRLWRQVGREIAALTGAADLFRATGRHGELPPMGLREFEELRLALTETGEAVRQASRRKEDELNIVLESALAATWEWNLATAEVDWSPSYRVLMGIAEDAPATVETWLARMHPDDREIRAWSVWEAVRRGATTSSAEYRILHPEHGERWIRSSGRVVYAADGSPLRAYGVNIDVTDMKRSQIRLEAAHAEALRAKAAAEQVSTARAKLLATASHDLRQPAQTLSLLVDSLARRPLGPEVQDVVARMRLSLASQNRPWPSSTRASSCRRRRPSPCAR